MTQADFTVANQTFPNTRTEINTSLQALATNSAGNSAPSTTFPSQWHFDSDGNILYMRNKDNDAWVSILTIGATSDKLESLGATGRFNISTGETVFNESSADIDFRVESNGKTHAIFVDAGNNHVNINTSDDLGGDLNVDGGIVVQNGSNLPQLTLITTDADANSGPNLRLFRNSSSPEDSDDIGKITFSAENSASEEIDYITVRGDLNDVTDGDEDGVLKIAGLIGGAVKEFARFGDGVGVVFNEESNAANDFRVESDGNANMIFVDSGANHVNIGTATDLGGTLNVNGVMTMAESDTVLLRVTSSGSNVKFQSRVSDKDIRFEGIDGGSDLTALHLDMSANGLAIFSDGIQTNGDSRINSGNNNNQALQIGSSDDNKEAIRIIHSDADNPRGIVRAYTGGSPDSAGADKFISCSDTGAERFHVDAAGDILADGVANASDERLKENIADATAKWNDIKALKVRNFTWKAEHHPNRTHKHIGFIAQEFETVFPALVKERNLHPDPTYVEADKDADGNLPEGKEIGDAKNTKNMKTIHTTAMIPMLTKALQEAMAKIEDLEARVTTLEG